ncbi:MAG TPA: Hsp20/alpha crystallin family protein [Thermoplasmata archaeon]|nr:Hsp20/alpha crystallin family protein [Thermoplasmata archaeon]
MADLANRTPSAPSAATTETDPFWADVDRSFRRLYRDFFGPATGVSTAPEGWRAPAAIDIADQGQSYELTVDLPGVSKEQVDIRVTGELVQIRADRAAETRKKGDGYLRVERSWAGFERSVELPEAVKADAVSASLANGVLTISVPKANPVVERKVPVQ